MVKYFFIFFIISQFFLFSNCDKENGDNGTGEEPADSNKFEELEPVDVQKTNSMKIYVHYMPWFETRETSDNGEWGQHWTMATKNPDNVDESGKHEIASYYYPLIGPYASNDEDVIEYHLLLMKYCGIDGILIDWYGIIELYDYPLIKRNTEALIDLLDEVGLEFAIVYEDRTINIAFENEVISDKIVAAKNDMAYLQNNYFSKNEYINISSKPLLLNFGPEAFHSENEWTQVFENLNPKPCFLMLWYTSNQGGSNATGEYSWVYESNDHLDYFYTNQLPKFNVVFGSAYPGFDDFYSEGGWGEGMGWQIDHKNGVTFEETLDKASKANINYLQLVTWNDFGEGTMIEPTEEFGYDLLEKVQNFAGVTYTGYELEKIYDLYQLRKQFVNEEDNQKLLDQCFYYFVSLHTAKAIGIVDSLNNIY